MPPPSDSIDLLEQARSGDRAAFASLLARYRERLYGRIRLMLGVEARRRAESSDFVQEAMLEAVEHYDRSGLRGEREFLRWLTAVARNNIRDAARRARVASFENLSGELNGATGDGATRPPDAAARREAVMMLLEALEELDEDHRCVIELRTLDELSLAEVSARMNRSEPAVRALHTRAMLQLARRVRAARASDR